MNPAKVYLGRIRTLDTKIDQLNDERDDLLRMATGNSSPRLDPNKVQTSGGGDVMSRHIEKMVDLEQEIIRRIDEFVELKKKIIDEIHELSDWRYITILDERYIKYRRLEEIAVSMSYSFDRVRHLHGEALNEFARVHNLAHYSHG